MIKLDEAARKAKLAALSRAMKNIDTSLKKTSVVKRLDPNEKLEYECINSGSLLLDAACSGGGYKRGTLVEIFGPESSGKSLLATLAAAGVIDAGGTVAYVDQEYTFDPVFAMKLGLDPYNPAFTLCQPDHMEDAMIIIDKLIDAGVDLIIVDSIAAFVPKAELEGDITDQRIGEISRNMSKLCRDIIGKVAKQGTVVLMINQVRDKIGVTYGDPTTTPGGRALKFYASMRLRVYSKNITERDSVVGKDINITVIKNKTAAPYKKANFQIYFDGRPRDELTELAALAVDHSLFLRVNAKNVPTRTGAFFTWPAIKEFRCKKGELHDALEQFPEVAEGIRAIFRSGDYASAAHRYDDGKDDGELEADDFDALTGEAPADNDKPAEEMEFEEV